MLRVAPNPAQRFLLPNTLLARSEGHYDLFSQDSAGPSRFGQLLASNITIDEAAFILNALPDESGPNDRLYPRWTGHL